jgi:putative phosphoribosyl transferase
MTGSTDEEPLVFLDRRDAGRRLAAALVGLRGTDPIVLALPRGGVPVAYEVAVALGAPLDVVVVRKLGAPHEPELAIGALVDGDHPEQVLNDDVIRDAAVSPEQVARETAHQLTEIHRRQALYRGGRAPLSVAGRTAIVVDDGLATGASMRAALRGVRRAGATRVVLAVPVAPPDTIAILRPEVDDVVCLSTPTAFDAVGQFYDDFRQTTDAEVIDLLARAAAPDGG